MTENSGGPARNNSAPHRAASSNAHQASPYGYLWRGSAMGLELVGSIIFMGFIGWLIDQGLGTDPWFLIILGTLGVIGGGWNFIRDARRFSRAATNADLAAKRARGGAWRPIEDDLDAEDEGERADRDRTEPSPVKRERGPKWGGDDLGMFSRTQHEILPEDYEDELGADDPQGGIDDRGDEGTPRRGDS